MTVTIVHGADAVDDRGRERASGNGAAGRRGHGIPGMRERAALIGGSLQTAVDRGRFVLQAHLPYRTEP